MKKLLRRVSLIIILIALSSVTLFGCEFSLYPKDYVQIVADNNEYQKPYNALSLVENIEKKMNTIQAFELRGTMSDGSTLSLDFITRDTIKNSSFSLEFNKIDTYNLKLNLRNQILYFKVPLKNMGIESDLNLGIKEAVDDLLFYLPLFANGLNLELVKELDENDYYDIFNKVGYMQFFLDYLLNLGENAFFVENYEYIINVKTQDNIKIIINKDYSLKRIESDNYVFNFSYPHIGEYVLEYPGEIVGIGYVTLKSIEDTLGESFVDLLS